jgi:hypothetical protein
MDRTEQITTTADLHRKASTMTWILIILTVAYNDQSMAMTNVQGLATYDACRAAGAVASRLTEGTTNRIRWVCVPSSLTAGKLRP